MYRIDSIFNVEQMKRTSLSEIVQTIRSKEMLDRVLPIRNAKTKDEGDEIKRGLPAFTLFEFDGRVDSQGFVSAEYIIYDVDGLGKREEGGRMITADDAIDRVKSFAVFAFISPSGKGIKFVIKLDRAVDLSEYRYNRKHYREILEAETGLKLDKGYNAYHTFFSYYKGCEINPNPTVFTAITPEVAAKTDDVNPDTIAKGELTDIKEFLAKQKLPYLDWTAICFSLQHITGGREIFKFITESDNSPEHAHRNWENKWKGCSNPNGISLRTLYHIAFKYGYKRKDKYIEDGRGKYLPFIAKEDGMWYKPKDKPGIRVFGFKSISVKYQIYDPIDGNKVCVDIDGHEIIVKATVFSSAGEFRKVILNQGEGSFYLITSSKATMFYDMLFDYLDKTKSPMKVKSLHGLGCVSLEDRIWNFGSVLVFGNKVIPYDPMLIVDNMGYALEDHRDKFTINDNPPLLKRKLNLMHDVYKEHAATAIGWAVCNIFYAQIDRHLSQFPILFLFGDTSSGKTKLAGIILTMFGVRIKDKDTIFKISLTSSTNRGMNRIKHNIFGIPTFFDEYRSGRKDHYEMLKNFFEGAGTVMARKTNDSQVHRLRVDSGSIFASVNRDIEGEAINRCVYIDTSGIASDDPDDRQAFVREFVEEQGLSDISAFILHVVCEKTWGQWLAEYNKLLSYISKTLADEKILIESRIQMNYAAVGAGYNLCRGLFEKHIDNYWWVCLCKETAKYAEESNPVDVFMKHVYKFAISGECPSFIFIDEEEDKTVLSFHVESALIAVKRVDKYLDGLITLPATELSKKLRVSPNFIKDTTKYVYNTDNTRKKIRVIQMKYTEDKR
jgi:hypothetical protein